MDESIGDKVYAYMHEHDMWNLSAPHVTVKDIAIRDFVAALMKLEIL